MHHYPHHIGDFARKTKGLTLTEKGAYRELLDWYYVHEESLPPELEECYRCAGAATAAERKATRYVLDRFFPVGDDGRRHNKRADEELEKYRGKRATAKTSAVLRWANKGAKAMRTHMPTHSVGSPDAMRTDSVGTAKAMPTQSVGNANQEALSKAVVTVTGDAPARDAWRTDDQALEAKAKSVGMEARPGESHAQLRIRLGRTLAAKAEK